MENRIWNGLANIKFRSIYTAKVSRRTHHTGNIYSFFLSFASASSVAAWAVWEIVPFLWASIVGLSQIMHVAKPYLPHSKNSRDFIEMSLLYESIFLEYEKLWYENRKYTRSEDEIEKKYHKLRLKEHEVDKKFKHIVCPEFKKMIKSSDDETNSFLSSNF